MKWILIAVIVSNWDGQMIDRKIVGEFETREACMAVRNSLIEGTKNPYVCAQKLIK